MSNEDIKLMRHFLPVLLTVTLLIFTGVVSRAQTVRVIVLDKETKKPVKNAVVQDYTNFQNKDTTNENGEAFLKDLKGNVYITAEGYEPKVAPYDPDNSALLVKAELAPAFNMLDQAVVSGGRYGGEIKKSTITVEKLEPDVLSERVSLRVDDGLKQVPGVTVTDNQINIRNGSGWSYGAGSRVMVMVDDMPVLSGDAAQPLWTFIQTDAIRSVEVIKGASSVLYGSSALNGVVNIRTQKPSFTPSTSATGFYGFYNKPSKPGWDWTDRHLLIRGANLSHLRRIGKWGLGVNGQFLKDDGYRMTDQDHRLRFGGQLSRTLFDEKATTGIRYNHMTGQSGSFLLWNSYDSAYNVYNGQATTTDVKRDMFDYYFRYYGPKGWKWLFQTRRLLIDNNVDNGDPNYDQSNSSDFKYREVRMSKSWTKASFHLGYVWQMTTSKSPLFAGKHTSKNSAPYMQFEWTPTSKLTLDVGGRIENYKLDKKSDKKPVMRGGINYRLADYSYIRASFGQGFRFPSIAETFIETRAGPVRILSNPDLQSETGWSSEIGFKQGFKIKKWNFLGDVAGFWMEYQNMMEFVFAQWQKDVSIGNLAGFAFKSVNVGDTRITGMEVSLLGQRKFKKKNSLEFMMSYTYSNPISLQPNKVFAYSSQNVPLTFDSTSSDPAGAMLKYRYKHLVRGQIRYRYGIFDLTVNIRYNSFMSNIDRAFQQFPITLFVPGVEDARKADMNGNYFLDVAAGVNLTDHWRLGVSAKNVLMTQRMNRPADMNGPGSVVFQLRWRR